MKKLLLTGTLALICGAFASADVTTVATLFEGERNVSWDNTLSFTPEQFAEASVGDFIYITFSNTTDVIELKSDGQQLPGSRYTWLGEEVESHSTYLTEAGLEALKEGGLELCGLNFTVSSVSICNDGFVMPENAVWGGYFWVSSWNSLEIWKTAFENYNGERYMIINLSDDNGDYTDYLVNVRTSWEDSGIVALNDNIVKTSGYAIVDLKDVNFAALLEATDRVIVQGNPEEGAPFNFTSVVLTNTLPGDEGDNGSDNGEGDDNGEGGDSGSVNEITGAHESYSVYTLQGILVNKAISSSAVQNLPKGMYILKGEKTTKKVAVR